MAAMNRRRWQWVALIFALVLGGNLGTAQGAEDNEFDGYNFAYAAILGSGYYDIEGRRALILRLPLRYVVQREDEERWGLRVIFPATLGWFNLQEQDVLLPDDPTNIGTLSVVPGVEFRRWVTRVWLLKPFVMAGPAKDFEGGGLSWLAAVGMGSKVAVPWARRKVVVRNRLLYASNFSNTLVPDDDLGQLETRAEYLEKLTEHTAIGFLAGNELYFNEVGVRTPGEPITIRYRWEAAVTWGPYEKLRWKKLAVPRVSLGYRFGQGISGIKVGFHFDY